MLCKGSYKSSITVLQGLGLRVLGFIRGSCVLGSGVLGVLGVI